MATEWTATTISNGKFAVTNGDLDVEVNADFSGNVTNAAGEFMAFEDLRDFIDAAKLLEKALIEHYGGYK